MDGQTKLPGRLGEPDMDLETEPRLHPKILEALRGAGLSKHTDMPYPSTSIEDLTPLMAATDTMFGQFYESLDNTLPTDSDEPAVTETTLDIPGPDGNTITLYIAKPASASGPLPCIVYTHGGGMVFLKTNSKVHLRWLKSLATQGVVAIAPDFRNGYTAAGRNPFPAGLNDCAAAARYISSHRAELGVSHLVLQGESGGGNLALATALKAKRDGWLGEIAGVYACVPYISNAYAWPRERKRAELPSLIECDGYWISGPLLAGGATYYSGEEDRENPLAWPYYASKEDLTGRPPTRLSMDELDPLRDEGVAFYRKLVDAGVRVDGRVNLGQVHGTSLVLRKALPEVHNAAVRDIAAFAKSLSA